MEIPACVCGNLPHLSVVGIGAKGTNRLCMPTLDESLSRAICIPSSPDNERTWSQ